MSNTEQYYVGTELKFLLDIDVAGLSKEEESLMDFDIELRCNGKKYQCKETTRDAEGNITQLGDVVFDEEGNTYLKVDTAKFGPGLLQMVLYAHVPDTDFEDNIRTEVAVVDLCRIKGI